MTRLVLARVGAGAGELADAVLRAAEQTGHQDDAAVLVVRHGAAPGPDR